MGFSRAILRGCVALGVVALPMAAQTKVPDRWDFGIGAGAPAQSVLTRGSGVAVGRAIWKPSRRLHFRGEATVASLGDTRRDVFTPTCDFGCLSVAAPSNPTSFTGFSGAVIVNDDFVVRGETGGYYVLGGGAYRALSPSSVGSVAGSIEGGVGFKFGAGSVEVKYVRIRHWIAGQLSYVPITVGYAW